MMKKIIKYFLAILFILNLNYSTSAAVPEDTDFNFIVLGDVRPALPDTPLTLGSLRILEEVSLIKPDLLFNTGDLIWGYGEPEEKIQQEFIKTLSLFTKLPCPQFIAPGNHDYFNSSAIKEFKALTKQEDYFSIYYKGAVFIILNTELPGEVGEIAGEQRKWLKQNLEKNRDARAIFIFMHRPLFPVAVPYCEGVECGFASKEKCDSLLDLITRYKVTAVFSGHEHIYHKTIYMGIPFITIGGGGASFSQPPEKGGFLSYMIVSIVGENVYMKLMEPFHFFVTYKYYNKGFKTYGEARINNIVFAPRDSADPYPLILRGIKLTLPNPDYSLEIDSIPSPQELLRMGKEMGILREISSNESKILKLKAFIYKIDKNRFNKRKYDIWVEAVSLGTATLKLVLSPKTVKKTEGFIHNMKKLVGFLNSHMNDLFSHNFPPGKNKN